MANVTLLVAIGLVFSIVTIPAFAQGPFHIIYPPQFTESDRIGSVSEEFSFQFTTDIGDPLDNIWAAISPNCALGPDTIDDTGLFTWVPTSVDMDKTCTINIILLADQTNLSARTFDLVVNAAPMNDVAVITEYNVDVKENQEIPSLSTVVTNPADSQSAITPTYRITSGNLPQSVMDSLDASTGEFSASFPSDTVTGSQNSSTFTFTWTYDDDVEESEPQDAIITVNPENRAPVIDPIHFNAPAIRLSIIQSATLGLTGSDPDGDVVLWSMASPVDGAEIDVDTGIFFFSPTRDHIDTSIPFEFLLTDINGAQSQPLVRVFHITDVDIPWLQLHITPVSLPSGQSTAHPLSPSTNPNNLDWEILSVLQSNDVIENPGITISDRGYLTWNPPHALIGESFIVNVKASESIYYRAVLAPLNVHVFDNAKPVISFITPLASDSSTGTRSDFVQVTDNNPNAEPAVVCIREDGSSITNGDLLLFGSNTITCTATDRASNKTVLTGTVLVPRI